MAKMEYGEFKKRAEESLKEYLGEGYESAELVQSTVYKVNQSLDSIAIVTEERDVRLMIYMDEMYAHYESTGDFDETMTTTASRIKESEKAAEKIELRWDDGIRKEQIIFQLINTDANEKLLSTIPHRNIMDLSIIYRWVLNIDEKGMNSTIITNAIAESKGLREEDLYCAAVENTRKLLPPDVLTMEDAIADAMGLSEKEAEEWKMGVSNDERMFILTNKKRLNGAANMLYEEELKRIAAKTGSGLYILPSSTHEVIVISDHAKDIEALKKIVCTVNTEEILPEERLSDSVYHYGEDGLTVATR